MLKFFEVSKPTVGQLVAVLYGVLVTGAFALATQLVPLHISPFAASAWVLLFGMALSLAAGLSGMWKGELIDGDALCNAVLVGILVFVSILLQIVAFFCGAQPLVCLLLMNLTFPLVRLGRKLFWGENLSTFERFVLGACVYVLPVLLKPSRVSGSVFAGNLLYLASVVIWSAASSLTRPQSHDFSFAPRVSWISLVAACVGLPILVVLNRALPVKLPFHLHRLPLSLHAVLACLVFGGVMLSARFLFLWKSSKERPGSEVSFLWIASSLLVGLVFYFFDPRWWISRSQVFAAIAVFVALVILRIVLRLSDEGAATSVSQGNQNGIAGELNDPSSAKDASMANVVPLF